MTMKNALTEEQKKLVEDNHNLIYSYMWNKGLSLNDTEDWYGVLATALCKTAKLYDPDRGYKFATLAFAVMDNDLKMIFRHRQIQIPEESQLSLDTPLDEKGNTAHEIVADAKDRFQSIYLKDAVQNTLRAMTERENQIIKCLLQNELSQKATAREVGMSQAYVSRVYIKFLDKIKSAYVA